jgi:hypothetical protein
MVNPFLGSQLPIAPTKQTAFYKSSHCFYISSSRHVDDKRIAIAMHTNNCQCHQTYVAGFYIVTGNSGRY